MRAQVAFSQGLMLLAASCSSKHESGAATPKPTAFGAAIVESSGGRQFIQIGACCLSRRWSK
jgi:hypothetical protein